MRKIKLDDVLTYALVLSAPAYFVRFSLWGVPTTVLEVAIYLIFILSLALRKVKLPPKNLFFPALLFVFAGALAIYFDPERVRALGIWKAYFFDGLLVFILVWSLGKKNTPVFIEALKLSGVLSALAALVLFFSGVKTFDGRLLDLDRLSPNYLAMFLAPIAVLALFDIFKSGKARARNILYFVVLVLALYLTGSRGGYLALGAGILTLCYLRLKIGRSKWLRIIFFALVAILFFGVYLGFRPDWSSHERKASSSNVRYYIWTTSMEIAAKNPVFGIGLSNYQDYFSDLTCDRVNFPEYISPQALSAHNLYLHIYLTMGILGIISFVLLLASSQFWRSRASICAAMISILIFALVDTPLFRNDLAAVFWILAGMATARREK